jgi:hypothetical protein
LPIYSSARWTLQTRSLFMRHWVGRLWAVMIVLLATAGCGANDGLDRKAISGEVTLDGRPLADGSILFDPTSASVGTSVGGLIRGGRFAIARSQGPVPGRYVVRIFASSGMQSKPASGVPDRTSRPMVELIPARYNLESTLSAVVTIDGQNTFQFTLQAAQPVKEQTR